MAEMYVVIICEFVNIGFVIVSYQCTQEIELLSNTVRKTKRKIQIDFF